MIAKFPENEFDKIDNLFKKIVKLRKQQEEKLSNNSSSRKIVKADVKNKEKEEKNKTDTNNVK